MTNSRPAAPDPILLLQDIAFALDKQGSESWAIICREAATALSLAQTEIKGHMRGNDELRAANVILRARIAELEKELTWCAEHNGECLGDHMQRLNLIRALLKDRA